MAKDLAPTQWMERIRDGQRFALEKAGLADLERFKNYYRHRGYRKGTLPVNMMFSILRSMVPQVYFRVPRVSTTARKPGILPELNARIVQKLDNWLIYELYVKREFKRMVADNFFAGIGTGFFGYDSEFGFADTKTAPDGSFTLTQFDKKGKRIEFNSTINPGMPWFLRARPDDVVFPWGSTSKESLEWTALRVFRKVGDIQDDEKYTNTEDLTGSKTPIRTGPEGSQSVETQSTTGGTVEDSWVELWQIHDARTGKIYALPTDGKDFLRSEPDETQIEGLPVETVVFNEDPDWIYGIPDARIIEPQLKELIDIRTQSMRHRRVDLIKALVKKGLLSPEAKQMLTSGLVDPLVEVETDEVDLNKVIAKLDPGVSGILNDLAAQGALVQGDIRELVGFSRVAMGEYQGKSHVTAAETEKVFRALNIRLDERRDLMADLLERVVRKWNQIIFTRWTKERIAQIVGPDGANWWLKFTGPQIRDEYDIRVTAEEGPAMDTETKKQLGFQAAETWAKLNQGAIKQGMPVPAEIQRLIFTQFEDAGLDIDKLLAQTTAGSQNMQAMTGGMGQSAGQAVSPAMLAQLQGGGMQR